MDFERTLLLSELTREQLSKEIEDFFAINQTGSCSQSTIWDAFKACMKGKLISLASYKRKKINMIQDYDKN